MDVSRSPTQLWRPTPGAGHDSPLISAQLFDESRRRALVYRWTRYGEPVPERSQPRAI